EAVDVARVVLLREQRIERLCLAHDRLHHRTALLWSLLQDQRGRVARGREPEAERERTQLPEGPLEGGASPAPTWRGSGPRWWRSRRAGPRRPAPRTPSRSAAAARSRDGSRRHAPRPRARW